MGYQQGWSYQTALDRIEESNGLSSRNAPPRIDIASIIAAKRQSLKKGIAGAGVSKLQDEAEGEGEARSDIDENEGTTSSDDDHKDEDDSDGNDGNSSENSGSDDGTEEEDNTEDSDEDDDDENDEVDDANHDMAEDILTNRIGGDEGDDNDEGDDDDTSDEDEEDKQEAKKAADYFDTQSATKTTDDVEVFTQLTLSRPLLRGIAAMGYVKPTVIQSSVIPVALAGRDICARYVRLMW